MLFCLGCINANSDKKEHNLSDRYPGIVDSLGLQHLYDETKWTLYCIYSDVPLYQKDSNNLLAETYGMRDLKFEKLQVEGDTVGLVFYFDPTEHREKQPYLRPNVNEVCGAIYIGRTDTIAAYIGYGFRGTMQVSGDKINTPNRYVKPLQPEVASFIKINKDRINPWFRKEALKRGVYDSVLQK